MTDLTETVNDFVFQQPLNEAQVDVLCLYLMEKLPIRTELGAVESKTWEQGKKPDIQRQLTGLRITQTTQKTQLTFRIDDIYFPNTHTRLYKGLHITEPERTHPEMQRFNKFLRVNSIGFTTEEQALLKQVYDTTKAYFQEHF
ncbi:MAG: hypothetical protein Q7R96_04015 [Nanoarchaeota archaeon]|nr:hypothetical protein [Nanoarchaeota archaeon]